MLTDSAAGYGLGTIFLHWICALLIIFLFGLGIYMTGLDYYSEWYHKGPALHISMGLILLLLMCLRVVWRLAGKKPASLSNYSRPTKIAANLVKYLLYVLVFIVLISGYLITTAEGKSASLFGLINFPSLARLSASSVDRAGLIHELLAWAIVITAVLHAGAALIHHFIIRDRTLIRMLKPVRKSPAVNNADTSNIP